MNPLQNMPGSSKSSATTACTIGPRRPSSIHQRAEKLSDRRHCERQRSNPDFFRDSLRNDEPWSGHRSAQADIALADCTSLRSRNFWILPVDVFGIGPNTTTFGVLKPDMWLRQ